MKNLIITPLHNPKLLEVAATLSDKGTLKTSSEDLLYLDIDDAYIHDLQPLIGLNNAEKPDYFSEEGVGAHISVIYPNEMSDPKFDASTVFSFKVNRFIQAETNEGIYYALTIISPSLLQVRHENQLENILNLKGYHIPMHITIGRSLVGVVR